MCHLEQRQPSTPCSSPHLHSTGTQARALDSVTPPNQNPLRLGALSAFPEPLTLRRGQPWTLTGMDLQAAVGTGDERAGAVLPDVGVGRQWLRVLPT